MYHWKSCGCYFKKATSYKLLVTLRKSNLLQLATSYLFSQEVTSNMLPVTFLSLKCNSGHLFGGKNMFITGSLISNK